MEIKRFGRFPSAHARNSLFHGYEQSFNNNIVNLDNSAGYVVYATSAATGTTAQGDTRTGGKPSHLGSVWRFPKKEGELR